MEAKHTLAITHIGEPDPDNNNCGNTHVLLIKKAKDIKELIQKAKGGE